MWCIDSIHFLISKFKKNLCGEITEFDFLINEFENMRRLVAYGIKRLIILISLLKVLHDQSMDTSLLCNKLSSKGHIIDCDVYLHKIECHMEVITETRVKKEL